MSSRAKKITLAISAIVLIGAACITVLFISFRPISSTPTQNKAQPIVKILGEFRLIDGTDFSIASVTSTSSDSSIFNELFSAGRWNGVNYGTHQYNLVFLDIKTETVYPLLTTNDYEIISMESFPKPIYNLNQYGPPEQKEPIAWWLFAIVKSDTNQDKKFSSSDKKTLSIADVGGRGYTEIIQDVDDLLGTAYKNNDTLLIIYRSNGKDYMARIDLLSRKVSSTEELPLGEEIK